MTLFNSIWFSKPFLFIYFLPFQDQLKILKVISRRSDRTLQTGRRRGERGRGPGLCTAAQKPRQTYDGSHESPGDGRDAQYRSFHQSPRHVSVPLAQKGEYLARPEAGGKSVRSKHTLAAWTRNSRAAILPSFSGASHLLLTSLPLSAESLRVAVIDDALCSVGL